MPPHVPLHPPLVGHRRRGLRLERRPALLTFTLAPSGSTGNNIHTAIMGLEQASKLGVEFVVEAAGATPTVTFTVQGTLNGTDWFNIAVIGTDASSPGGSASGTVVTAVGKTFKYVYGGGRASNGLSLEAGALFFQGLRLVTTANTNITYHANLYRVDNA